MRRWLRSRSIQQKIERSREELDRLRAGTDQREKPSITDLEAKRAEFTTLGEVILLRCIADELRQERERQGLTQTQWPND